MLEDAFGSVPSWSYFQPSLCESAAKRKLILIFRHMHDEEVLLQPRCRQKWCDKGTGSRIGKAGGREGNLIFSSKCEHNI